MLLFLDAQPTPPASLLDKGIAVVIILFILSMISERFVTWIKLRYGQKGNWLFLLVRKDTDLVTKGKTDEEENLREQKILGLNISISIITAVLAKANLFAIINSSAPNEELGWKNIDQIDWTRLPAILLGCILTGFFISLGSKFWHDLLDILFEVKNYKRALADPETFKVDNVKSLEKILSTYQSDFIRLAYNDARSKYMAMDNVKAISLKQNGLGYYFEVTVKEPDAAIERSYLHKLSDGTPQTVSVRVVVLDVGDDIEAHKIDLSARVFRTGQAVPWGTLGCLVNRRKSNKTYLLTCCHNIFDDFSGLSKITKPNSNELNTKVLASAAGEGDLGSVYVAVRDHEIDAALIEVNPEKVSDIEKRVPKMGTPAKSRTLMSDDIGVKVSLYGAGSQFNQGTVTGLYSDIKISYGTESFQIINLITAANKGSAISKKGDSGSCVLDENNNVVGILVAGNSKESYIISIDTLLTKLDIEIA